MSSDYVNIPGLGEGQSLTPVADIFDLPMNGNNLGDTRIVLDTYLDYFWNGSAWTLIPSSGGGSGGQVTINQATSSVAIGDSTTLYTGQTIAGAHGLDVNIIGGNTTVSGNVDSSVSPLSNFQTSQYPIGTSVTQLTPTPLTGRNSISLRVICTGSNSVYIGPMNTVSVSNGYPLFNGDTIQMDLDDSHTIYAVSGNSGQTVCILEIS